MSKYRIIKSNSAYVAQVSRWYWPFWTDLKGYSTLYLMGDDSHKPLQWCREAIENHKNGRPLDEPEWKIVE